MWPFVSDLSHDWISGSGVLKCNTLNIELVSDGEGAEGNFEVGGNGTSLRRVVISVGGDQVGVDRDSQN